MTTDLIEEKVPDQAGGLRTLFGNGPAKAWCLASALTPDATVTLGIGTAHALRHAGHRILLVDEVPLADRQQHTSFSFPVRYDLSKVMCNLIGVQQALAPMQEKMWFATGMNMRKAFTNKKTRMPHLSQRLVDADIDVDFIVIATNDPFGGSLALYGAEVQRIIVAAPDETSMMRATLMIRELSVISGGAPIPVLIVGGDTEEAGMAAFDKIASVAESVLAQPLDCLGWIRAASASAFEKPGEQDGKGLTLPVTLYQMMAKTISALDAA
jgi:hypothetical protein